MGTMESLMAAGLDVEFEQHLDSYFIGSDEKKNAFRDLVDQKGLKDPIVMKTIGAYQKENQLKPGIYKEFLALAQQMAEGGNGSTTPGGNGHNETQEMASLEAETVTTTSDAAKSIAKVAGAAEVATKKLSPHEIDSYEFSAEQEEIIRKRLAAEEDKIRRRLLAREKKIREDVILGRQERQTRWGVSAEDAEKLSAAYQRIRDRNATRKVLLEENKVDKALIDSLRPRRAYRKRTDAEKQLFVAKRRLTMANKAGNEEEIAKAREVVTRCQQAVDAENP